MATQGVNYLIHSISRSTSIIIHTLGCALFAVVLSLSLTAPASADFGEGLDAYKRGNYATAFEKWLPEAWQGVAAAQNNLGIMYEKGNGVAQDNANALKWYRLAAEQHYARAQYHLGKMYYYGKGVPQSTAQAVKFYRLAAEQGVGPAQGSLGLIYFSWSQDFIAAYKWLMIAVAQEDESLDKLVGYLNLVTKYMSPADIMKAQRLAQEWLAEHGA